MRLIDADELIEHAYRDKLDSRKLIADMINNAPTVKEIPVKVPLDLVIKALEQRSKKDKYEYHIDHTDCIWYGNDSGCPVTCSQYRDGWNDAMEYIYENGKGYQPYRRE